MRSESLQVTACGRLAMAMPIGLRYGRFLALAWALGELRAGVFMTTMLSIGDIFGGVLLRSEMASCSSMADVAKMCRRRLEYAQDSGSDVIAAVNMCIRATSYNDQKLLEEGIGQQVHAFIHAFLYIGGRLVDYLTDNLVHKPHAACADIRHDMLLLQKRETQQLRELQAKEVYILLQVLAGSPCLLCGHEEPVKIPPHKDLQDQDAVKGSWVYLDNILANAREDRKKDVQDLVVRTLQHCPMPNVKMRPMDDGRSTLLWSGNRAPLPPTALQMLKQWCVMQRGSAVYDGKMQWHSVLPRLKARVTKSFLDGACNPQGPMRKQCLVMCQSFGSRRAHGTDLKSVRAEGVLLLPANPSSALWILCGLCGRVQVRFWRGACEKTTVAFELQVEGEHRPDVFVVPLSSRGFDEAEVLRLVNGCRFSLNQFFDEMSSPSQTAVGQAFAALRGISEATEAVVSGDIAGADPAGFVSFSQWPANRSMVVMLDLSSSWGLCSLREFSQEKLDNLGGCSLTTILKMLETGKDV
jgi:hypothetical protein